MSLLSQSERDFIVAGCTQDCRADGRSRNEFRPFSLLSGNEQQQQQQQDSSSSSSPLLPLSAGSARLVSACGRTHLLASVKAEVVKPAPTAPDQGVVQWHVETLTTAPATSTGTSNSSSLSRRDCDELAQLLSRLLLPPTPTPSSSGKEEKGDNDNRHSLCILPHHYVWRLHVDLYLLASGAGCLLDLASHVVRAALQNTLLPRVTTTRTTTTAVDAVNVTTTTNTSTNSSSHNIVPELLVDGDLLKARPPKLDVATIVTVTVLKNQQNYNFTKQSSSTTALVLDATAEEEACAHALVHIAMVKQKDQNIEHNEKDKNNNGWVVTAIQKSMPGPLPLNLLPSIMATALQGAASANSSQTTKIDTSGERGTSTNDTDTQQRQGPQRMSILQEQFSLQ